MSSGHYVVCGVGHLGEHIVRVLHAMGERVTIVAEDVRRTRYVNLDHERTTVVRGDARDEQVLEKAARGARAIITATDHDLRNMEIALTAARIAPDVPVVVRLFDMNLAETLERSFNVRRALGMSAVAAPIFAARAGGSDILAQFVHEGRHYVVDRESPSAAWRARPESELAIPPKERVAHRAAIFSAAIRLPAIIWRHAPAPMRVTGVALLLFMAMSVVVFSSGLGLPIVDTLYFLVATVTTTGYGDISAKDSSATLKLYTCFVMLLGSTGTALLNAFLTDFIVAERFRQIAQAKEVALSGHCVVVGLGNVGYRVVDSLRRRSVPVVGIDINRDAPLASGLEDDVQVICGDARLHHVLSQAAVARAESIVATTSDDVLNFEIILAAKRANPRIRCVIRLFDPAFASKVQEILPMDFALSASRIAAPMFVAAAIHADVTCAFVEGDELVFLTPEGDAFTTHRRTLA